MALLTLDQVKDDLGIAPADTNYDIAINKAMPIVTKWFEQYCQRGLEYITNEQYLLTRFRDTTRLNLWRYPLSTFVSMAIDGSLVNPNDLLINEVDGWIEYDNEREFNAKRLAVIYSGGYPPTDVPADLRWAFSSCVGDEIGYGGGGAAAGGGSGELKSIGLGSGALEVSFDTGGTATGVVTGGITGGYDVSNTPVALQPYADVLNCYRRHCFHGQG